MTDIDVAFVLLVVLWLWYCAGSAKTEAAMRRKRGDSPHE